MNVYPALLLSLTLALPAWSAETAVDEAPPLYRYLVAVDLSRDMDRQQEQAADTVSRLLMGGVQRRAQPGQVVGLWLVGDRFHTNALPPTMWIPSQAVDLGNEAFRLIRDQPLSKSSLQIDAILHAAQTAARESGRLTLFLVTSGFAPLSGTSFDNEVNFLFQQHRDKMRKARKPFVLVFQIEDGGIVAHSASPAGNVVHIPPFPKETER